MVKIFNYFDKIIGIYGVVDVEDTKDLTPVVQGQKE